MNPLRVLGMANPLKIFSAYFRRHPWQKRLLIALPFLIVLALLDPVLGLVTKLLGLVERILTPLLDTGIGRAVLLVLLLLVLGIFLYVFARERVLDIFRRYAMSLHLKACEALLLEKKPEARRYFQAVLRLGRWLDLSRGPAAGHGNLAIDARIKLARMALDEGQARKARAWLARIPIAKLEGSLALSHAELEARIYAAHPDHLKESVRKSLARSHATWPGHPGICKLYVDHLLKEGEEEAAAEVLAKTLKKARPSHQEQVRTTLASIQLTLARKTLHTGDLKLASQWLKKSLGHCESAEALLLRADLHLAHGELQPALRVLSGLDSPLAKARFRQLLREDSLDGRTLLSAVPRQDALDALAEHYLDCGDLRKAGRALRASLRDGEPTPRLLALWASLEIRQNRLPEARKALQRALQRPATPDQEEAS